MADGPRMTTTTKLVLRALAAGHRYGTAIIAATGLASGTIHPILARLEAAGWVRSEWESPDSDRGGRGLRRIYDLTDTGRDRVPDSHPRP